MISRKALVFAVTLLSSATLFAAVVATELATSPDAILATGPAACAQGLKQVDAVTISAGHNLNTEIPAENEDGTVNVVVEIPAGTLAKWEVNKEGVLEWEVKKDKLRIVQYLPYPGNYGMVPSTVLPKELGGDGDPLDVLILGPTLPRGTVARVRLIGVMKYLDRGEQDDKILAVMENTPLGKVTSMEELDEKFKGVSLIAHTWFDNYKGPGKMEFRGWGSASDARDTLTAAKKAFESGAK
ncbi:MAG: inorganic diphosphatase [Phycisphaera sp.]|nr:inorganic diphosphatase [Phycisphaera sp.]